MSETSGAQPLPNLEQIKSEIQTAKAEKPIQWTNNFFFKLPGGFEREITQMLNSHDEVHEDAKRKDALENLRKDEYIPDPNHSRLYLEQTNGQFFQTIDETIIKSGYTLEKVEELVKAAQDENSKEAYSLQPLKDLEEYLEPVYIDLRMQGYTHYDLTA